MMLENWLALALIVALLGVMIYEVSKGGDPHDGPMDR
jgi:hypothetical protein